MKLWKIITIAAIALCIFSVSLYASEIHEAAKNGNLEKVKALLEDNPELLNEKDSQGFTPLHSAVTNGRIHIIRFLIEKGADIEIKNNNGLSPLFTALDRGRDPAAHLLIEKGADVNVKGFRNRTLLHTAARTGNIRVARLLVNHGAEINARDSQGYTPLDLSLSSGQPGTARFLKENGGSVNTFNTGKEDYNASLKNAVFEGNSDLVRVFVEFGVDIKNIDEDDVTFLHIAAAYGQSEAARILIDCGYDVNAKTKEGKTPLFYAAGHGHKNTADELLSRGAAADGSIEENYGESVYLNKELPEKEAYIWYLGHSGWAVKTKNHLLVFDYVESGKKPSTPLISNGYVNLSESQDLHVTVFVSHGHTDHYNREIHNWKNAVPDMAYVLGFRPRGIPEQSYTFAVPRTQTTLGNMQISAIKSTDAGVGFLITVDGLTIFHGGDHSNKDRTLNGLFSEEIDFLAEQNREIDIAFILVGAPCGGGSPEEVRLGIYYVIDKLSPKILFPMHARMYTPLYREFAEEASAKISTTKVIPAQFKGDRFYYRNGDIRK